MTQDEQIRLALDSAARTNPSAVEDELAFIKKLPTIMQIIWVMQFKDRLVDVMHYQPFRALVLELLPFDRATEILGEARSVLAEYRERNPS